MIVCDNAQYEAFMIIGCFAPARQIPVCIVSGLEMAIAFILIQVCFTSLLIFLERKDEISPIP